MDTGAADRLAVRERLEAYADAVFRKDADDWGQCWAEDGVWDLGRGEVSGRANIVKTWVSAMTMFEFVVFQIHPGVITIEGDRARSRSYVLETLFNADGAMRKQLGQYDDELARDGATWRFARRSYKVLKGMPS